MVDQKASPTLLLVDDQEEYTRGLARLVEGEHPDYRCLRAASAAEALDILEQETVSLMLTDLRMPGMDGLQLLKQSLAVEPALSVVLLTGYGSIETAVEALKAGAYDFLTKPVDKEVLLRTLGKGLERNRLLEENLSLRSWVASREMDDELVGESIAMRRLKEQIRAVAQSDYTVLITGESGTGKERISRAIHKLSSRRDKPLLTVNCPAIPDQLLESELFGHEKGSFTGADRHRKGIFVEASGGTLLLDEIGDISMNIQTKLLRVLQEREVRPVGSSRSVPVDVRILASTNRDLQEKIREGLFREDLFYRLNVLTVQAPPLSRRCEDVPLLANYFLAESCQEMGIPTKHLAAEVPGFLAARHWPGNVRELQNFMRRLCVFCRGEEVDMPHVYLSLSSEGDSCASKETAESYKDAKARVVEAFTRAYVTDLLQRTQGNVSEAARLSGLERVSLQKIIKRHEIDAGRYR